MITGMPCIDSRVFESRDAEILPPHAIVPATSSPFKFLGIAKGPLAAWPLCPALVACGFLLLVAVGCDRGPERVPVAGRVLIDGQPLTKGTIRFVPDAGRAASARIAEDGSFRVSTKSLAGNGAEIMGLLPDRYRMAVLASESLGESENAEVRWLAPQPYADFRTSGLEVDIKEPTENMVVKLTWEGAEGADNKIQTEESSGGDNDHKTLKKQKSDG